MGTAHDEPPQSHSPQLTVAQSRARSRARRIRRAARRSARAGSLSAIVAQRGRLDSFDVVLSHRPRRLGSCVRFRPRWIRLAAGTRPRE
jgi:hypothetical protein